MSEERGPVHDREPDTDASASDGDRPTEFPLPEDVDGLPGAPEVAPPAPAATEVEGSTTAGTAPDAGPVPPPSPWGARPPEWPPGGGAAATPTAPPSIPPHPYEAPTRPDIIPGAAHSGDGDILPGAPALGSSPRGTMPGAPPSSAWAEDSTWAAPAAPLEPWQAQLDQLRYEIRRVIVGQHRVVERVLVALLAGGHCLLEGAPGLGKTKLLATLARTIGGSFARIQFTPDLIPSDIVGTRIYRGSAERFDVELGPIFANLVLADEINRAPAKVQSALLEVMAEHQVTIGGETFAVPDPFLVLATQNPIEHEGVYALPEAQRDRFLMRVPVDFPTPAQEAEIVRRGSGGEVTPDRILTVDDVLDLQRMTADVHVDPRVADYAVRLVLATRTPRDHGLDEIEGFIDYGASPRATLGLLAAGRALAVLRGRRWVSPQEVFDVAYDVLNHRLVLSFEALAEGTTVDEVLVTLLSTVRAPVGVTEPAA